MLLRLSASFSRSSCSAWVRPARPTANFSTWLVSRPLMPARSASSACASVSRPSSSFRICSETMPSTTCRLSFSLSTSTSSTFEIELRPSANFWIWLSTRLSMADKSAFSARERMSRPSASFSTCAATMPSMSERSPPAWRDPLRARATGCCGLRPACRHGRRPFRQCPARVCVSFCASSVSARARLSRPAASLSSWLPSAASIVARCSLILRRSSSRAREIMLRPSASFCTWHLPRVDMARPSANFARSAAMRPPCGRGSRPACAHALDRLVDAGARFRQPLDVGVEGPRNDVAGLVQPPGEIAGAGFEHRGGRRARCRTSRRRSATCPLDHARNSVCLPSVKVVAISLARSTSVSLIWRARASSAALSLAVPVSSASARVSNSLISPWPRSASVRSMLLQAGLEFGAQGPGRAAEQRHHAGRAIVEQIGQRPGQVVGAVGQLGDAGVEQAGEGLARGRQAIGDRIDARIHRIEQMSCRFR